MKLNDALSMAVALETVEGQFLTMKLKDNSNQPKFGQVNRLSHTSSYGKPRNMPAKSMTMTMNVTDVETRVILERSMLSGKGQNMR